MSIRFEPCSDCNNCEQFTSLQEEESTQAAINAYCETCIDHKVVIEDDN